MWWVYKVMNKLSKYCISLLFPQNDIHLFIYVISTCIICKRVFFWGVNFKYGVDYIESPKIKWKLKKSEVIKQIQKLVFIKRRAMLWVRKWETEDL